MLIPPTTAAWLALAWGSFAFAMSTAWSAVANSLWAGELLGSSEILGVAVEDRSHGVPVDASYLGSLVHAPGLAVGPDGLLRGEGALLLDPRASRWFL